MRVWLAAAVLLLVSACTTFSKEQCASFDWYERGYETAMKGNPEYTGYGFYQKECGQVHGIQPVKEKFTTGFGKGVERFCTPENGMSYGLSGARYQGICPEKLEGPFLAKYQLGKIEFTGMKMQQMEGEMDRLRHDNYQKERKIEDLERRLRGGR